MKARLDFGGIAVHANKRAAIERRWNVLADAVGPLLIGNGNSEPLGLVFDFLLKYQLLQDLLGVKRLKGFHVGIALLDLVELLAHVLHADGLITDLGHGVRRDFAADRRLRDEVEQHAPAQNQYDDPQENAVPELAFICASHPMSLPRQ